MVKRGNYHIEFDVSILSQLLSEMEKGLEKIKRAYEKKNAEEFIKLKKSVLSMHRQINKILSNY